MWIWLHLLLVLTTVLRIWARPDILPPTRLAWFMVIIIVPLFGVLAYFLFGEVKPGPRANRRYKAIIEQIRQLPAYKLGDVVRLAGLVAPAYKPAFRYATCINGFGTTIGNKAELMPNAQSARARLLEDVEAASKTINILYYIWLTDKTGTDMANALIRAARRGVICRVMVDGLGSHKFIKSKLWKQMKAAGVTCSIALPYHKLIRTILFSRIDLRNHRKITVIDGRITWCGSQNCADPEFLPKAKYGPWIDILLRFEGPVVAQNQLLFASDWMLENDDTLEDFNFAAPVQKDGFVAQVWGDGPTERSDATPEMFSTLIDLAQKSLTITTPYFIPDEKVLGALCATAHRGVELTMVFPARNDSWIVRAASRSYYPRLLEAGVKIFEYEGGLLHAKTLTMDGKVAQIGSSNMDRRSFDLNYENNILLYDKDTTHAIIKRQQDYINKSCPVTLESVRRWRLPKRIWQNIIATLGPVL